jgi:hypothetical protein
MDDARSFDDDSRKSSHARDVQPSSGTHRIEIAFLRYGQGGTNHRVTYRGETLIESTKGPLLDACRALVALDHAGRLEMWGSGSRQRMRVHDIEQGAKLTVVKNVNAGARFASPHPGITDGDDAE